MQTTTRFNHEATTAAGQRAYHRVLGVVTVAGATMALLVGGCSTQDRICGSGEYPVKAVGSANGGACQPNGQQPPAGYVRYPAGKVPERVGDKWDTYWDTVVVDSNGTIVKTGQ